MLDVELHFPGRLVPTYEVYLRRRGDTTAVGWWLYQRGYSDIEEVKEDVRAIFRRREDLTAKVIVISTHTNTSVYHPDFSI